tara:strand:- start:868 stop:1155 length:288 start_codon:yes stop_codon:yes gene_type:complete
MYIYKIYFSTDTNYNNNLDLISELETLFLNNSINLNGFTIIKTKGYWKGEIETAYIFEYIEKFEFDSTIKLISKLIKGYYKQKEVLTTKQKINIL